MTVSSSILHSGHNLDSLLSDGRTSSIASSLSQHLASRSTIYSFQTGSGSAIYSSLKPLLEATNHELILVTCFWARSETLNTLNDVLEHLSDKAIRRGTEKIQVRLCFSSSSLFQKLFHIQSLKGQTYDPSTWKSKLGIADISKLNGLDIEIKSIFLLPFSVMHPKFIVIDRKMVALPSCNISWEVWFEGCLIMSGMIVDNFLKFYSDMWCQRRLEPLHAAESNTNTIEPWRLDSLNMRKSLHGNASTQFYSPAGASSIVEIETVFLPSPHHRNPRFQPFTSSDKVVAPVTPLNSFLLRLFAEAKTRIRIQTPNLTAPPVLSGLLKALQRGVDVQILTSEKLMILEQLVTAGTTTVQCVRKLIRRYENLAQLYDRSASDEEIAIASVKPGKLSISYFRAAGGLNSKGREAGEPQQSHLKMTIVDDNVLILGSGNLDRASWFTSQELGVAFFDKRLVEQVEAVVNEGMTARSRLVYNSI